MKRFAATFLIPLILIAILLALCGVTWSRAIRSRENQAQVDRLWAQLPRENSQQSYVSSSACQSCHPGEHASWHRSFHRSMTQPAQRDAVLGDFDRNTTIDSGGLEYRVFRRGDEFWADMPDPDGLMYAVQGGKQLDSLHYLVKRSPGSPVERFDLRQLPRVERQVVMTTGSHHYQTYWVKGDAKYGNLLQTLPLIYLLNDKQWIPREQAFMHPPESGRMVTQWNHHCIRCHSTGGVPGIDTNTGGFATSAAELGISCEACHGPGERHVLANRDPRRRYRLHMSGGDDDTIVNPSKLDHERSSQVCGQCHGVYIMRDEYALRYAHEGTLYRPGDDLTRTRYYIQHPNRDADVRRRKDLMANPDFFRERWWPDGSILAGGREFTALSGSGCYKHGEISCLSCHVMHGEEPADQLSPIGNSNTACTQCHQDAQYTSQIAVHTHHVADSSGSSCLNCHMPHTAYALLSAIRSHDILSPNVVASATYGVPNACNLCHLDKTLEWSQQKLGDWYGADPISLTPEQRSTAASLLWILKGDAAQRAVTAWHFGWEPARTISGKDWYVPSLAQLLRDPYGVVRYIAAKSLATDVQFQLPDYDFLAERTWSDGVERLTQIWNESRIRVEQAGQFNLLYDDAGNLQSDRLKQLLNGRDNRPVTIKE